MYQLQFLFNLTMVTVILESNELTACIQSLIKEQKTLCHEVANSTLSATRLRQRLVIARRYFTALSRHKPQENKDIISTPKPVKSQNK